MKLMKDFQALKNIWNHPYILLHQSNAKKRANKKGTGKIQEGSSEIPKSSERSTKIAQNKSSEPVATTSEPKPTNIEAASGSSNAETGSGSKQNMVNSGVGELSKALVPHLAKNGVSAAENPASSPASSPISDGIVKPEVEADTTNWHKELFPPEAKFEDAAASDCPKMEICLALIEKITRMGEKLLVFSHSLKLLHILEFLLQRNFNYEKNREYLRLDGQSDFEDRAKMVKQFNLGEGEAKVFLISTRAGGIGINLTGANHAIIYDVDWNPSHNLQAIYRIYRFGQQKNVYIYHLIAQGTMEQRVYERCIAKQGMALRVVDKKAIKNHFSSGDLHELYTDEYLEQEDTDYSDSDMEEDEEDDENAPPKPKKPSGDAMNVNLENTGKKSLYNPYERKHIQVPEESLLWWTLAKFGTRKLRAEAKKKMDEEKSEEKPETFEEGGHFIKGFHTPQQLLRHVEAEKLSEEQMKLASLEFEGLITMENGDNSMAHTLKPPPKGWPINHNVIKYSTWTRKEIGIYLDQCGLSMLKGILLSRITNGAHFLMLVWDQRLIPRIGITQLPLQAKLLYCIAWLIIKESIL